MPQLLSNILSANNSVPTIVAGTNLSGGGSLSGASNNNVTLNLGTSLTSLTSVQSTSVQSETLTLGGTAVTSTATEINLLDGVTATTAEINYANGVTSNIQTQLDAKVGASYTGDVNITGELLVDSYNETFKQVSSVSAFTAYSISGAAYDSVSFSVSSQEPVPRGLAFADSGTKMYICGNNDTVYQYTLTTGFDVSTASYASKSFSVASQVNNAFGVHFKPDGTKMFVVADQSGNIFEYDLSTAYDVSTASYNSATFSTSAQLSNMGDITFSSNGTKMYLIGSNYTIYQYALSTAWDITSLSYESKSFSVSSQDTTTDGIHINSDGTKIFVTGGGNDKVFEYTLGTAYDISTAVYSIDFSIASQETDAKAITFNSDGTKFYILGVSSDTVYQYSTTDSKTTTFDCENANVFETQLDGATTVVFSNPPAAGTATDSTAYAMSLKVVQDSGASGYTVTWPTSVDWPSATAPTLTATASAVDQFVFYTYDGGTTWYGFTAGQALA